MNKFDYYLDFHNLRLNDADFAAQYDAHEFDLWYADVYQSMVYEIGE